MDPTQLAALQAASASLETAQATALNDKTVVNVTEATSTSSSSYN